MLRQLFILTGLILYGTVSAEEDWPDDPFERATAVNDGDLAFLPVPPDKPVHHHINRLEITTKSLENGWVTLNQCHHDIDPVPDAEIAYSEGRIRQIQVTRHRGIEQVTASDNSIQLENVAQGALLCVSAETRNLYPDGDGFVLRNGPYMRRFLDGFYPMHVTLEVRYPPNLVLKNHQPAEGEGVAVSRETGAFTLDTWFEGILRTSVYFSRRNSF